MPVECYRLTIEGVGTGNHVQNVLHFNVDNNDDAQPLQLAQELIELFRADPLDAWLSFQSNRYAVRWIQAKRILPGGGNSYWNEFPEGSKTGLLDQEQGAASLAPVVKLYAGLDSGVQGRVFLPSPIDTAIVNNQFDSDWVEVVDAWITATLSFSGDHDWFWSVFSKKNNNAYQVSVAQVGPLFGQIGRRRQPL